MRPLSQHQTADVGRMACFAPNSLVWDGGFFSVPLSEEPLSLPWLGGPAPSSQPPAFPEAPVAFQGGLVNTAG